MLKFENDNDITILERTEDEPRTETSWENARNRDEMVIPEFTIKEEEIDVETV